MTEVLSVLAGLFDLANLVSAAARCWRTSMACLVAALLVCLICFLWDAPAIRWLLGFHLVVLCITAGIVWEMKCGRLGSKSRRGAAGMRK